MFNSLIDRFENNRSKLIKKQVARAYGQLAWFELLEHNCRKSKNLGIVSKKYYFDKDIDINLGHSYLCLNETEKALDIYLKYKGEKTSDGCSFVEIILDDLASFIEEGMKISNFNRVKKTLKGG